MSESLQHSIDSAQKRALVPAVVLTVLAILCALFDRDSFWKAYLMGFTFVVGIPLGSLALLMLHHLVGGTWGFGLRRILEASTRCIPLMVGMFFILILGMNSLYGAWLDPHHHVDIILLKSAYLNRAGWILRGFICFAIWGAMAYYLNLWSRQQDETGDLKLTRTMRVLSGPGVVLYVLAVTVAGWDWGMSLDPAWFSSMYGPLFMICQGLTTLAFCIVVVAPLARFQPLNQVMKRKIYHDVGNLTFAFGILWAYMSIAQYLIIWSGNVAEEVPYYLNRTGNGWQMVAVVLALFHFAVPFLILLMRNNKLNSDRLVRVAWWILAMRFVDLFWHIYPSFYPGDMPGGIGFTLVTVVVPAAMVAWFAWNFFGQLKGRPLLPVNDPRFETEPPPAGATVEAH